MKTEQVTIKSKGSVLEETAYAFPETLEEGLKVDGPEKVFALYAQQRKIRFMDGRRRTLTGGGIGSAMAKALKGADPAKLLKIAEMVGDKDLVANVKALLGAATTDAKADAVKK